MSSLSKSISFIILSEFIERAKAADSLGYILKPLDETQILAALEIAIDKSVKEKRAREKHTQAMKKSAETLKKSEDRFREQSESLKKFAQAVDVLTSL